MVNGAEVNGADVRGAVVNGDVVSGADVRGADVNGAVVNGAVVSGAVVGAVVSGDVVRGAVVNGAEVNGADVRGAVVNGAGVGGAGVVPIHFTFTANPFCANVFSVVNTRVNLVLANVIGVREGVPLAQRSVTAPLSCITCSVLRRHTSVVVKASSGFPVSHTKP